MSRFIHAVALFALGLPITALAQDTGRFDSNPFRGRHEIEISIGLLSGLSTTSEASVGGISTKATTTGFAGSLSYGYWFADEWAINLSVGVANADASTSVGGTGASVESAVVVPILVGVKYAPLGLAINEKLRPYAFASLGPHFGFASDVRAGVSTGTEAYTETALGSRLGFGMELLLGRRFTLGFAAGYRLVSDFGRRIGSEKNHSSPEFSLSLGIVIGSGQE